MAAIDIAGFFEKVWSQVAVAERAAGDVTERWFEIAGRTLHLRLIGSALQKVIVPALSHLERREQRQPRLIAAAVDAAVPTKGHR